MSIEKYFTLRQRLLYCKKLFHYLLVGYCFKKEMVFECVNIIFPFIDKVRKGLYDQTIKEIDLLSVEDKTEIKCDKEVYELMFNAMWFSYISLLLVSDFCTKVFEEVDNDLLLRCWEYTVNTLFNEFFNIQTEVSIEPVVIYSKLHYTIKYTFESHTYQIQLCVVERKPVVKGDKSKQFFRVEELKSLN